MDVQSPLSPATGRQPLGRLRSERARTCQGRSGEVPPFSLVMIQPTPFCNIDCAYCYLPNRSMNRVMSSQVLESIVQRILDVDQLSPQVTFLWHAGEPLAVPLSFYEDALERIDRLNTRGSRITHAIQTNATLLTQPWCDFIKRHRINLGVSLDGPAFLHDAQRRTRQGHGTHARVMAGIALLKQNAIPFHVISVLTNTHLDYVDEIFRFYIENGIDHVGFNVEEIEGIHASTTLDRGDSAGRFRAFMRRFRELSDQEGCPLRVREFDELVGYLKAGSDFTTSPNIQATPLAIVAIDHKGSYTTFSPELLAQKHPQYGDFFFGNVMEDPFDAIAANPKFTRVAADIARGVEACRQTCPYFALCGGGAPVNKLSENGTFASTETMFCRLTRKILIDIILDDLEQRLGLGPSGGLAMASAGRSS